MTRFLACSILGVEGHAGALGWGLRRLKNKLITYMDLHNQTISWLVCNWNIFGA